MQGRPPTSIQKEQLALIANLGVVIIQFQNLLQACLPTASLVELNMGKYLNNLPIKFHGVELYRILEGTVLIKT